MLMNRSDQIAGVKAFLILRFRRLCPSAFPKLSGYMKTGSVPKIKRDSGRVRPDQRDGRFVCTDEEMKSRKDSHFVSAGRSLLDCSRRPSS